VKATTPNCLNITNQAIMPKLSGFGISSKLPVKVTPGFARAKMGKAQKLLGTQEHATYAAIVLQYDGWRFPFGFTSQFVNMIK